QNDRRCCRDPGDRRAVYHGGARGNGDEWDARAIDTHGHHYALRPDLRRDAAMATTCENLRVLVLPMTTDDVLHPIFELQLPLLEVHFFDLFGLGEVRLLDEFVQSTFELVMFVGEVMKLFVGLHQELPQVV